LAVAGDGGLICAFVLAGVLVAVIIVLCHFYVSF
jgi:tetrahydromethanopterin S-methyltransferase subunit F